jgi:hypothetical protein
MPIIHLDSGTSSYVNTPQVGKYAIFIDSVDSKFKKKDSDGIVTEIGGGNSIGVYATGSSINSILPSYSGNTSL